MSQKKLLHEAKAASTKAATSKSSSARTRRIKPKQRYFKKLTSADQDGDKYSHKSE